MPEPIAEPEIEIEIAIDLPFWDRTPETWSLHARAFE